MPELVTALLVRWKGGYLEVEHDDGILAYGRIVDFLSLGHIESPEQASIIGEAVLARRAVPAFSLTAGVEPGVDGQVDVPFDDYDVGDTITAPDEALAGIATRVTSIGFVEDEIGEPVYAVELATRQEVTEERFQRWLKRQSLGTMNGSVSAFGSVAVPPPGPVTQKPEPTPFFSSDQPLSELLDVPSTVPPSLRSRRYTHWAAELTEAGSTASEVTVYKNGASQGTIDIASSDTLGEADFTVDMLHGDRLQVEVTVAGTGAVGIVVSGSR